MRFRLLLALILMMSVCSTSYAVDRKRKVLVLHSYHQGLEWSDNISKGIQRVFLPYQSKFELYYEYLDSKRNVGTEYLDSATAFINKKNANERYELVLAVDNNALSLLNSHKIKLLDDPAIIFCGINNYQPALIEHLSKVTGVAETTDHIGTLDLIRQLHPERNQVTVILDQTPTGLKIKQEFTAVEKHYEGTLHFHFLSKFLLTDIPNIVQRLDQDDVLYILTFNRDRADNFISYAEGIDIITSNSQVPIYGSWGFYLNKGIIGGKITTGAMQGEIAANIALSVLFGKNPDTIDVMLNSPTKYQFDFNYLKRYNVDISKLPAEREIINKPLSFYERNQTMLLDLFISLVVVLVAGLYFSIRKQIAEQKKYALQLEKKVEIRTDSLSQANRKLELLSNIDGLSEIYNRRYFDQTLHQELLNHCRDGRPLSLIIIDIDYFKRYNDYYGHLAGDDCIREVSRTLNQICQRDVDTVARYGGEEFTVILPHTDSDNAFELSERVRLSIMSKRIPHIQSLVSDVITVSIGVTTIVPNKMTKADEFVSFADCALYKSKNGGRNKVTFCNRL